ncbi:hypothetical protein KJ782_06980 [Patescibacteria group bacterium]|nr:hypothetical protein [Patescibacteria group bacterium]
MTQEQLDDAARMLGVHTDDYLTGYIHGMCVGAYVNAMRDAISVVAVLAAEGQISAETQARFDEAVAWLCFRENKAPQDQENTARA